MDDKYRNAHPFDRFPEGWMPFRQRSRQHPYDLDLYPDLRITTTVCGVSACIIERKVADALIEAHCFTDNKELKRYAMKTFVPQLNPEVTTRPDLLDKNGKARPNNITRAALQQLYLRSVRTGVIHPVRQRWPKPRSSRPLNTF